MKKRISILASCIFIAFASAAETDADAAWLRIAKEPINGLVNGLGNTFAAQKKWGRGSPEFYQWDALSRRWRREQGTEFWFKFPESELRWQWLSGLVMGPDNFDLDIDQAAQMRANRSPRHTIPVDRAAKRNWEATYAIMRAEFLASPVVTEERKRHLLRNELRHRILDTEDAAKRGEVVEVGRLISDVWDFAERYPEAYDPQDVLNLMKRSSLMETLPITEKIFVETMKHSANTHARWLAVGRDQMARLRDTPLDAPVELMDGIQTDLASMRGKVTLVYFWTITCSGCVHSLPGLEALYQKYQKDGFRIVGLCFDNKSEEAKVRKVLETKGVSWPQSLQGRRVNGSPLAEKFGIIGFPVSFLLDASGRLVTNDVAGGRLESEIRRLLDLEDGTPAGPAIE
jgi:thiol-disulfide isomerase/thioredoxin